LALQRQTGARVILDALISERGEIVRVQPLRRVGGDSGFDQAAMEAVKRWKYRPATLDGVPVASAMTLFVDFSLR
jgi:protein TonB